VKWSFISVMSTTCVLQHAVVCWVTAPVIVADLRGRHHSWPTCRRGQHRGLLCAWKGEERGAVVVPVFSWNGQGQNRHFMYHFFFPHQLVHVWRKAMRRRVRSLQQWRRRGLPMPYRRHNRTLFSPVPLLSFPHLSCGVAAEGSRFSRVPMAAARDGAEMGGQRWRSEHGSLLVYLNLDLKRGCGGSAFLIGRCAGRDGTLVLNYRPCSFVILSLSLSLMSSICVARSVAQVLD
jgi:hypothetical protein